MNNLKCPLCHNSVFSEFGKGCKICGMTLEDDGKDFCSKYCRNVYLRLRRVN